MCPDVPHGLPDRAALRFRSSQFVTGVEGSHTSRTCYRMKYRTNIYIDQYRLFLMIDSFISMKSSLMQTLRVG